MAIPVRSPDEIDEIDRVAAAAWSVLAACAEACVPGVDSSEIERVARDAIQALGAEPLFVSFVDPAAGTGRAFGAAAAVSVNDVMTHGLPGSRVIESGDAVTIDVGLRLDGWCADAARSVAVGGAAGSKSADLVRAAADATRAAIEEMVPGAPWSKVAAAVRAWARAGGWSLAPGLGGHGIGRELHEPPTAGFDEPTRRSRASVAGLMAKPATAAPGPAAPIVAAARKPSAAGAPTGIQMPGGVPPSRLSVPARADDFVLRPGMVLCVEPIVCQRVADGEGAVKRVRTQTLADGWSLATVDGRWAAYEERMVAITVDGPRVLGGAGFDAS